MQLKVKTIAQDEDLAILKKEVVLQDRLIKTPSKTLRPENVVESDSTELVCEVSRRIDAATLEHMHKQLDFASELVQGVKRSRDTRLSMVHFNLRVDVLPDKDHTITLAHSLYSASDDIICLPSVKKSVFLISEPGRKTPRISEKRVDGYIEFQKQVIEQLKIKNTKAILGTIPLCLPPKFTNQLIDFYFDQEINHFVIDANTSNLLNNEANIRAILSRITANAKERNETLEDTFIHAINLGINQFESNEIPAEDFLSLFAYIDSVGITFKSRGINPSKDLSKLQNRIPRRKEFSRQHYVYRILGQTKDSESTAAGEISAKILKNQNERNQHKEALYLKERIGKESMTEYLGQKRGMTEISYKKLQNIHSSINL